MFSKRESINRSEITTDKTQNSNNEPVKNTSEEKSVKPITICGWCGAVEIFVSEDKTECPNCDEYLH